MVAEKERICVFKGFSKIFQGVTAAAALLLLLASCQAGGGGVDAASLRGGETRATMNPDYFNGYTAEAYRIAKEIPEVLDSLYCYCDCAKHSGHKSLLTCYVNTHAAYCDICMAEAFMAAEMHSAGADAVAIRKAVDEKYSRKHH